MSTPTRQLFCDELREANELLMGHKDLLPQCACIHLLFLFGEHGAAFKALLDEIPKVSSASRRAMDFNQ
ncbi:MAG: hypothetical protein IPL77_16840 [Flavobacteriales bacterium]|nr:hypothetical protein [Flavobacteriales bacterium]